MTRPHVVVDDHTVTTSDGLHTLLTHGELTLRPGKITAISGESGSGKTTLMQAVLGHLPPGARLGASSVRVLGHDVLRLPPDELRALRREHLAFVGQDPGSALNPTMRVRTLLGELADDTARRDPGWALDRVGLPASMTGRRPGELSGGQQRRVALARALVRGVDVLLVDEPFAGLDARVRDGIVELLRELADEEGLAIGVSGHQAATLDALADEHVVVGPAVPVSYTPAPCTATPAGRGASGGRISGGTGDSVILAGAGIRLVRGGQPVLDGAGIALRRGRSTAVVGASGAGKTSLARVLAGLESPATGTLHLDGDRINLRGSRRRRDARRVIQLVPQNPMSTLNPARTVAETLARPLQRSGVGDRGRRTQVIDELLESVGLTGEHRTRYPHELSGGQRQRVSVARALAHRPEVLICDEVTSALDEATAASIMELLRDVMDERRIAVMVISHDLDLVRRFCDSTLTLTAGRLVET
ncbi:ATP-binding cassette domain-containing protein [Gordonia sp. NB41Y]|uniref:ABC transporter ATP-binding protein n=1 Tax=Gordonia sp. NB41Y TaxID=875808 RepID=UPI0006B217AA|nr:ATP-binding cassette domain-containing protein [Gordonia sp. NB41Y]KOY50022.1 hypothetical protein ISGA_06455 [Gordonia sp. NB41Y]WLP89293.1 ATP-binding cassette domain-containing protein [Gordonia sp. NB41Y]